MFEINATNLLRAMNCPGWLFMPSTLVKVDDPTARDEGTAAHWVAQQLFHGHTAQIGGKAPNGFIVSGEMIDHVQTYLAALNCGEIEIVTAFAANDGERWRVNGRADHIKFDSKTLTIDDFKYGWRIVEPEMNWTLIAHAIGYCVANAIQPETITLRIHQPRPHHPEGPLREWSFTWNDLLQFHAQIDATLSNPTQTLRTGNHCAKCHALPTCPAARSASMNAIDASGIAFTDDLSPEILAYELDTLAHAAGVLKTRLEALQELATHRIKNGEAIPNYIVGTKYGDSRFKTGFDAPMLRALTGIDCAKVGTVTPAEAKRRAVNNPGALLALENLIERPMIGTKLTRIDPNKAAKKLLKR